MAYGVVHFFPGGTKEQYEAALAQHVAEWANYLQLRVTPVMEDTEAGAGLSKAYGKQGG